MACPVPRGGGRRFVRECTAEQVVSGVPQRHGVGAVVDQDVRRRPFPEES